MSELYIASQCSSDFQCFIRNAVEGRVGSKSGKQAGQLYGFMKEKAASYLPRQNSVFKRSTIWCYLPMFHRRNGGRGLVRALVAAPNRPPQNIFMCSLSSTTQTTTMSGLPQQRYGSITLTRGTGGEGSKARASRYVKIKRTSYRPNTRGKMNDLTAKNAFRR